MLDFSAIADKLGVMNTDLLIEIRSFLARSGMGETYFGKAAVGNSELVKRLENGRRIWPDTEEKVRAFIAERSAKLESAA